MDSLTYRLSHATPKYLSWWVAEGSKRPYPMVKNKVIEAEQVLRSQYKHARQGICRLGVTLEELTSILHKYALIEGFAITYETEANEPHLHYICFSSKKIPVSGFRNHMHAEIERLGKAPPQYKNGMANIQQEELNEYFKSLCYIYKDYEMASFESISHNIQTWIITLAKQESYRKHGKVSRIVKEIHKELLQGSITAYEATIRYITLRCQANKPDPHIVRAYDNFKIMEISKDQENLEKYIKDTLIEANRTEISYNN